MVLLYRISVKTKNDFKLQNKSIFKYAWDPLLSKEMGKYHKQAMECPDLNSQGNYAYLAYVCTVTKLAYKGTDTFLLFSFRGGGGFKNNATQSP